MLSSVVDFDENRLNVKASVPFVARGVAVFDSVPDARERVPDFVIEQVDESVRESVCEPMEWESDVSDLLSDIDRDAVPQLRD